MKILVINSVCGFSSTGGTSVELAKVLEDQGHECYIAYGQGTTSYEKSFKIGGKIENHLHNIGSRILGKQGYFSKSGTLNLIKYIEQIDPDVIHLRNLHGHYLHLETLFTFLKDFKGKVVLTLHDCWAFTGKCAYYTNVNCNKWETECGNCPQLKTYPPSLILDYSKEMHIDKKKWFGNIKDLTIQPVSKWLEGEVKRSFLKDRKIKMVYNWINHSIFKPYYDINLEHLGVKNNKFTILFVSASWSPNTVRWEDLLKITSQINNKYQIIVVGKNKHKDKLPKHVICIDYIEGKENLAKLYSFADVYIHLSIEDTFGKVIAEAMSCGTPAIVYNSTACGEIVGENCGYSVEKRNINQVLKAIENIKMNGKNYYSEYCISHTSNNFDYYNNANEIIKLYNT